ncbi:hypothetical protein K7432_012770 [Basidiobolus ranarum]|uniref:BHLH domain-containing protein n=1 Tax=Basidiobolus ranarum TaxID=34480 RepID=A0ABR2VRS4_9FUNG
METTTSTKLNKGNILRIAAEYIKELQAENSLLKSQLANYNDRMYTYSGVQASPVSIHPIDGPSYTESQHREIANKYNSEILIKTENSGCYNPSEVLPNVTHSTISNGQYGYSCYQYQRLPSQQPSVSLPVTCLPLPSIIQSSEHASLSLPKLSQSNLDTYSRPIHAFGSPNNPPYHPMQHRGLMLTDHYNTLNLF